MSLQILCSVAFCACKDVIGNLIGKLSVNNEYLMYFLIVAQKLFTYKNKHFKIEIIDCSFVETWLQLLMKWKAKIRRGHIHDWPIILEALRYWLKFTKFPFDSTFYFCFFWVSFQLRNTKLHKDMFFFSFLFLVELTSTVGLHFSKLRFLLNNIFTTESLLH